MWLLGNKNKIKQSRLPPPILEEVQKLMGKQITLEAGYVFTYGDTCHAIKPIPDWLVPHEKVHVIQQSLITPKVWWEKWLADPNFRFEQELEAYRVQYKWVCENKSESEAKKLLSDFANNLSGAMYGNIINYHKAMKKIKNDI